MSREYSSVIFDFDYTLADSSIGIIECANYALLRLGLPAASDDAIRRTIGMSLTATLPALAGDEHAELGEEFMRLFIERADEVMHDSTVVYEFVPSLVDALDQQWYCAGNRIVQGQVAHREDIAARRDGRKVRHYRWRRGCGDAQA